MPVSIAVGREGVLTVLRPEATAYIGNLFETDAKLRKQFGAENYKGHGWNYDPQTVPTGVLKSLLERGGFLGEQSSLSMMKHLL